MLGFFSSKNEHPLADVAETRAILAELAGRDPHGAVDEAVAWLESLATAEGFKPALRLERVLQIDEAAGSQVRRLGRDYLAAVGGANRAMQNRLWESCQGYWRLLADAYGNCLQRHSDGEKDAEAMRAHLPLLYLRRTTALTAWLKWDQFRYGPIDGHIWAQLGATYLAAVRDGVATRALPVGSGVSGSVEAEYMKALVFHASSMDKLTPVEIELAERFIAHYLPFFALTREVKPENVYWVDCARPLPPTRLARLPEASPSLRFFHGARALDAVQATLAAIAEQRAIPSTINLGGQYTAEAASAVLQHLAACWAPTPPMRSHARRRIASGLAVAHGLAAAHKALAGRGGSLETWQVEDISLGGMGAQAPVLQYDWIRIGALLALQPEGGDNWLVGAVRRYARTAPTVGAVGIETLSRQPRAVVVDSGGFQADAILLDVPAVGEHARMVLAADALEDKVAVRFTLDGKGARLHPTEVLERGEDYVLANFFVQSFS